MPFKSEKQRKWMWANKPEMAEKWTKEEDEIEEGIMKITKRQLRKIIKEAISKEPTGFLEVEWNFDGTDYEGMEWEDAKYEADLPELVELPEAELNRYINFELDDTMGADEWLTGWLSDEYGFFHDGWSWITK